MPASGRASHPPLRERAGVSQELLDRGLHESPQAVGRLMHADGRCTGEVVPLPGPLAGSTP